MRMERPTRTKLTLSVDEAVVAQAKKIARANGTSVSAMFSQFIKAMANGNRSDVQPGRVAKQASGLVRMPEGKSGREVLGEALAEKYGLRP